MNCKDINDLLSAYIDNELGADEKMQIDSHLRDCPHCGEKLTKMKSAVKMVRSLGELEVPADVSHALRGIAHDEIDKPAQKRRMLLLPRVRYLIAAGAVAAIALVALLSQIDLSAPDKSAGVRQIPAEKGVPSGKGYSGPEAQRAESPSQSAPAAGQADLNVAKPSAKKIDPWPEVIASQKNYDAKAADRLLADVKKRTENLLTVNDAKNLRGQITDTLIERISSKTGTNGELMRSPINSLLDQTKRSAAPVYMEKAKFNKQGCWVVVIRWGFGGVENSLYRASIYVTDPSGWSLFYYASS